MKKVARGILVVAALGTSVADAQSPPSAATVLANVQQFYANANQLTALFRQTVTNATFNTTKVSDGQLWVAKPANLRWDYMEKINGAVMVTKSFVFNGTSLWLVNHQNKQIIQNQIQSSVLPAAVSFLTGGSALASQFNAALNTSGAYGSKADLVLELTPKQPSAQYKQLFFVVDPANWHVRETIVIDSNGDTSTFNFYTPDLSSTVMPSWFQVNPASLPNYKLVQINAGTVPNATPTPTAPVQSSATPPVPTP